MTDHVVGRHRVVRVHGQDRHVVHGHRAGAGQGVGVDRRPGEGDVQPVRVHHAHKVAHVFSGLAKGEHTITIRVLGQVGAPSASDTQVAVDAFRSGGKTWLTPDLDPSWRNLHIAGASGGSVVVSDSARASLSFRFRGTGVTWETVRGPAQGRAQLFIDGALVKTVDNYAKQPTSRVTRTIAGLLEGVHELRIVVLGSSRPASRGAFVSVDGFSIT